MAKKEFAYRGKSVEEIKALSLNEFAELIPSAQRRKIKRGFTEQEQILVKKLERNQSNIETHCRDMVVIPLMLDKTIKVHNGKEFVALEIEPEMLGHVLGEFVLTRKLLRHSSPGVGATKSSSALSVR